MQHISHIIKRRMEKDEYDRFFSAPSDVSKAQLLRTAIANAKKNATKKTRYSGYYRLKRKQLNAVVNKVI